MKKKGGGEVCDSRQNVGIALGGAAWRRCIAPVLPPANKKAMVMPRRGYRKGVSDTKRPVPRRVHTRLTYEIHALLMQDAVTRGTPAARIIRDVLTSHYMHQRPTLPHPRGPSSAAIRELARVGNNLNQIAHQANLMRLNHLSGKTLAILDAVNTAVRRLA